jgi:hypothetical protein
MKQLSTHLTTIATATLVIGLLLLVISFQKNFDARSDPFTTKVTSETRNLLPARFLPYITFGFDNFITDSYWIRAIQDFTVWDAKDPYYLNYFNNISTLDPTFEYPYLFSILIVPQNKNVDTLNQIATIAERGIEALPTSWKIPFYLGTQYFLFTKNYSPAESYLAIASKIKGAPDGVFLMYSTFAGRNSPKPIRGDEDYFISKSLLKVIFNNTDNEIIKKMAASGIEEKQVSQMLEKGIIAYKEKFKRYPLTVDEMLAVNFISLPAEFLANFSVQISQKDGSFRILERKTSTNS